MIHQIQFFEDVPELQKVIRKDRKWLEQFLKGQSLVIESYSWGEFENPYQVLEGASPTSFSILFSGFIEVFEEHFVESGTRSRRAYRPIKILEPGDIFGDFELADEFVFSGEQCPLNEEWGIAYGGRSALLFVNNGSLDKELFVLDPDNRNHRIDFALHHFLSNTLKNKEEVVKIARFDLSQLDNDRRVDLEARIMKLAWKKAYTYRQCANSYNVQERFRFLQLAKQRTARMADNAKLSTSKLSKAIVNAEYQSIEEKDSAIASETARVNKLRSKAEYDSRVNYDRIIDIFIESLFDAINRPIRDEPVYAESISISNYYRLADISDQATVLFPVRISRDAGLGTFYFPLGLANFLMCNYVSLFDEENEKMRFFEGLGAEALLPPTINSKGSKSHFWKTVADRILDYHRDKDPKDNAIKRLLRPPYNLSLSIDLKKDFNDDYDLVLVFTKTSVC